MTTPMNETERAMWFQGLWTRSVIGIRRTESRRPFNPDTNTKSQRVWMTCRHSLDSLWFVRPYKADLALCRAQGRKLFPRPFGKKASV